MVPQAGAFANVGLRLVLVVFRWLRQADLHLPGKDDVFEFAKSCRCSGYIFGDGNRWPQGGFCGGNCVVAYVYNLVWFN